MPPLVATTEIHVDSHTCYHELECIISLISLEKRPLGMALLYFQFSCCKGLLHLGLTWHTSPFKKTRCHILEDQLALHS